MNASFPQSTPEQYNEVARQALDIFTRKTIDYGTSWRVLRTISVADQLMIKALRIRNLQEGTIPRVEDSIENEFAGIFNYALIGLIQLEKGEAVIEELPLQEATRLYIQQLEVCREVMKAKNNDYGEAWRAMSQQSFADLILVKLLRIRQILANDGHTLISEGIDANYTDIVNYAAFALILSREQQEA